MEALIHTQHSRRKKNSAKVNLTISVVFHALLFALGAYWAAHEGVLGKKMQELSVLLVPKEKKPEQPKKVEPPRKVEPEKIVQTAKATAPAPKMAVPPPPPADVVAAPPPPAVLPSFSFGDGSVDAVSGPVEQYKGQVENSLRSRWERPMDVLDLDYVAEVEMSVDNSGNVTGYTWKKGSGNKRWDDSVKKAIAGTKFISRPPPKGFPDKFIVRFDTEPTSTPLALQ